MSVHTGSVMPSRRRAHQAAAARTVRVSRSRLPVLASWLNASASSRTSFLCAALPGPGEMTGAAGATQPSADGGRRAAKFSGNPPVSQACGLAGQRGADHLGGVRPAWLQRGRQQDLGGSAPAATHPPGPLVDRVRPEATNASAVAVSPPCQGAAASAVGAAHLPVGQGLLGRLGGADDDHRAVQQT